MNWYLKRTGQALLTIFVVFNLTFVLIRQLPGGPIDYIVSILYQTGGSDLSASELNALAEAYVNVNPDAPLYVQYLNYLTEVLHGDLGKSIWYGKPVTDVLLEALPWTVFLFGMGLILNFVIGIVVGALMAYYEGSRFDSTMTVYSIVGGSIPYYVIALLLVFFLAVQAGWFPKGGRYDDTTTVGFNVAFLLGVFKHATLPLLSMVLTWWGGRALQMRGNCIQELGKEYLRVAELRGLSDRRIATRYVGRNAILPLYTGLMISIGSIFGGSVILETIFNYKGLGYFLFQAISARDFPLMMGAFMLITTSVVIGIYIADLTYGLLDPRIGNRNTESYGWSNVFSLSLIKRLEGKVRHSIVGSTTSSKNADIATNRDFVLEGTDIDPPEKFTPTRTDRVHLWFAEHIVAPVRILLGDWRARVGLGFLGAILFMGTVGVITVPEPASNTSLMYVAPFTNGMHPLGTSQSGAGIFTQLVYATPQILKMVAAGAVFASSVGALVGTFSGYVGGAVDRGLMILTDTLMTLPGLPLVIVLAFFIDPSNPYMVGIILAINNWTGLARQLRSQVLTIRNESYVESSRFMGISTSKIVFRDILPNLMPFIAVSFVQSSRKIIFESVGLYFLGILSASGPNWGVMMNVAYRSGGALYNPSAFHWLFFPMLVVIIFSLGAILLAQSADKIFNPRVRTRHTQSTKEDQEQSQSDVTSETPSV